MEGTAGRSGPAQRRRRGRIGRSGPAVAADCQDDITRLLLRLDVPRRVNHLLQWITPVDDRPVLPGLHQLLEEEDVLLRVVRGYREHHPLVPDPRGPQGQDQVLPAVGCQVEPAWAK